MCKAKEHVTEDTKTYKEGRGKAYESQSSKYNSNEASLLHL